MNRTVISRTALIAALVVGGAACGGSDDASEPEGNDDSSQAPATDAPDAPDTSEAPETPDAPETGGSGNGTLTLEDGTVYTFEMSTCETSDTDPDIFLVDPGFDAFGRTSDGFTLQLIRAAFEESPELQPTVGFEGGYDENGVNPETSYIRDGDADLQVDGGRIFGEVTLKDFFSSDPVQGDGFVATVDVNC